MNSGWYCWLMENALNLSTNKKYYWEKINQWLSTEMWIKTFICLVISEYQPYIISKLPFLSMRMTFITFESYLSIILMIKLTCSSSKSSLLYRAFQSVNYTEWWNNKPTNHKILFRRLFKEYLLHTNWVNEY